MVEASNIVFDVGEGGVGASTSAGRGTVVEPRHRRGRRGEAREQWRRPSASAVAVRSREAWMASRAATMLAGATVALEVAAAIATAVSYCDLTCTLAMVATRGPGATVMTAEATTTTPVAVGRSAMG
jgi:hypothetical protein